MNKSEERILKFIEKNKDKHIFIYGAGRVAKPIAEFLIDNGIKIKGFVVSDKSMNKDHEMGILITQVDNLTYGDDEAAFIIGVKYLLNEEIKNTLISNGYTHILEADEDTRNMGGYNKYFYENPMLEITTKIGCKVNCKYCPQDVFIKEYIKNDNSDMEMSFETFRTCIDNCPTETLIVFAGFSEPFFVDSCMDMVEYAVLKGFKVNMFTTLVGLNAETFERMLRIEFEEFVLHVPDEEGYSMISIDDEYLTMIDRLAKKHKKNGDCFITYACSQGRVPTLIKKRLGSETRIYVSLTDRAGNLEDKSLYSKKNINGSIRCSLSKKLNHNVLLPDGRVLLCAQDWAIKHVIGNLKYDSFEEIQRNNHINEIYKMLEQDGSNCLCRDCCHAIKR